MTTLADTIEQAATPEANTLADKICDAFGLADPATREDAHGMLVHAVGFTVGAANEKLVPLLKDKLFPWLAKLVGGVKTPAAPTTVTASVTVAPAVK